MHSLYRHYRPRKLNEVWGQKHVVQILSNALLENKVSHAYIFHGPHGIGKTTVARILANELGASGVDLIELDAASNRGIDDIRELREGVSFQPAQSPNKVYILDEVHMLTNEAFNALLKVLEEPPAYVYFILCTTESHKIPDTVLSRCQQLTFFPPTIGEVRGFLKKIIDDMGVEISDDVVDIISEHSNNAYRDALVLLEKVIRHGEVSGASPIDTKNIIGVAGRDDARQMLDYFERYDHNGFLIGVKSHVESGVGFTQLVDTMIELVTGEILSGNAVSTDTRGDRVDSLSRLLMHLVNLRSGMQYTSSPRGAFLALSHGWFQERQAPNVRHSIVSDVVSDVPEDPVGLIPENVVVDQKEVASDDKWLSVLARVKGRNHGVDALLKAVSPDSTQGTNLLKLVFSYSFHLDKVREPENWRILQTAVNEVWGSSVSISCELKSQEQTKALGSVSGGDSFDKMDPRDSEQMKKNANSSEAEDVLKMAQDIFGGQLID